MNKANDLFPELPETMNALDDAQIATLITRSFDHARVIRGFFENYLDRQSAAGKPVPPAQNIVPLDPIGCFHVAVIGDNWRPELSWARDFVRLRLSEKRIREDAYSLFGNRREFIYGFFCSVAIHFAAAHKVDEERTGELWSDGAPTATPCSEDWFDGFFATAGDRWCSAEYQSWHRTNKVGYKRVQARDFARGSDAFDCKCAADQLKLVRLGSRFALRCVPLLTASQIAVMDACCRAARERMESEWAKVDALIDEPAQLPTALA